MEQRGRSSNGETMRKTKHIESTSPASNQSIEEARSALDNIRAGLHPRALLTMAEAAVYLRYLGPRASEKALHYLQRSHVKLLRRGRIYLVRQSEIDQLLETGKGSLDVLAERAVSLLNSKKRPRVAMSGGER